MLSSQSEASFSECGKYRWSLIREFDNSSKKLIFIGLNPSLANSVINDPTLLRLINFAKSWGYGSLVVINLFARISKDPYELRRCSDPIGHLNQIVFEKTLKGWSEERFSDLWLGWGTKGTYMNRNDIALNAIEFFIQKRKKNFQNASKPYAIGVTKSGHPRHPLYVSAEKSLRPFFLKKKLL